jgi:uncharacterized protein
MKRPARAECRLELTLQPVSGRALPLRKGEVLRISQIDGGQAVGFNCFNLNDYKEYMSVGHIRREDFRLTPGRFIWSNPPRYRPMMKVLGLSKTCVTDVLVSPANAVEIEARYGIVRHPNIQDTLADAIAEFSLTPDDTHDPLHFWRNTQWDHVGPYDDWNPGRARDHVDLLAIMDVLAVPAICGAGNFSVASNFSCKPIKLEIFAATKQTLSTVDQDWKAAGSLKTQASPKDFKNVKIRTNIRLNRDRNYIPHYLNFPIEWKDIEVTFTSEEYQSFWHLRGILGDTDEELVRTLFFHWYLDNRKKRGRRSSATQHS